MEDALVHSGEWYDTGGEEEVLILVVMEDALVHLKEGEILIKDKS